MENDQNVLAFYLDVDPIQEVIAENVPVNEEFLKGFSYSEDEITEKCDADKVPFLPIRESSLEPATQFESKNSFELTIRPKLGIGNQPSSLKREEPVDNVIQYNIEHGSMLFKQPDVVEIEDLNVSEEVVSKAMKVGRFNCENCGKLYNKLSLLKTHQRTHIGEKPFKCESCTKTFNTLGNLKQHERIHSGEKPYKCKTCEKKFIQMSHLKQHRCFQTEAVPSKQLFTCEICSRSFRTMGNLKQHQRIHTGEKPYKCTACEKKFIQMSHLKQHRCGRNVKRGEKPYDCETCKRKFSHLTILKKHCCKQNENTFKKPARRYQCKRCGKSYTQQKNLNRHSLLHAGEQPPCKRSVQDFLNIEFSVSTETPYRCCGENFVRLSQLEKHFCDIKKKNPLKRKLKSGIDKEEKNNEYKTINTLGNLKQYQRKRTSEKHYQCTSCKNKFIQLSHLKQHQCSQAGTNVEQNKCDPIGSRRDGEQDQGKTTVYYTCEICGKNFLQQNNLKRHNLLHSGERVYECDVCEKSFNTLGNLKQHQRIHTGEKPYECQNCEKKFIQMSHLKQHRCFQIKAVPSKQLITCDVCEKSFKNMGNLKQHQRIHTGEKPYKCQICEKKFNQMSHLKQHQCEPCERIKIELPPRKI